LYALGHVAPTSRSSGGRGTGKSTRPEHGSQLTLHEAKHFHSDMLTITVKVNGTH